MIVIPLMPLFVSFNESAGLLQRIIILLILSWTQGIPRVTMAKKEPGLTRDIRRQRLVSKTIDHNRKGISYPDVETGTDE